MHVPALTRRLAAIGALLAPLAMLAVVVVGLRRNALSLLAVIALGGLALAAVWIALTHRGTPRILALLGAAAALAGQVVFLLHAGRGLLWLLALFVLLAAYGSAARYALHEHHARLHRPPEAPVPAARHGVLIVNPTSGDGTAERVDLEREAVARGIRTVTFTPGDDLRRLAEDAVAGGADVIGMAGGDGSQALVAAVAMEHDVPYVCVPAGTRNHLALDLGLDRTDVVGALDAFDAAVERRIDLARVNDRVFVNNASLGVYAKVIQSDEYRDAKLETWRRMLPDLFGPDAPPIDLAFVGPDGTRYDDAPLVLVSNNVYQLAQLAGAGTRARLDRGELGIVVTHVRAPGDVAQLLALEVAGQAERFPGLMAWSAPTFEVASGAPVEVGLDGEALLLQPPLRFTSLPGALRVRIPDHAPGLSPAAVAAPLNPRSLGALVRVALGRPAAAARNR